MSRLVRLDDDAHDTLTRLAEEEDRPMTRVLGAAIDLYDEIKLAKIASASERLTVRPIHVDRVPSMPSVPVTETSCAHPKDKERRFVWGTVCGSCGTRIR